MPVTFGRPELLLLLPVLALATWWIARRSLAGLDRGRRRFALGLRLAVVAALIAAAAEVEWRDLTDKVEVVFVVDHSRSIPEALDGRVRGAIERSRERMDPRRDLAKLVVFGRQGLNEGTVRRDGPPLSRYASDVDRDHSNLEAGVERALGALDADVRGRIVLFSDGNATAGDARRALALAEERGARVDVVPLEYAYEREVLVDKLVVPSEAKIGEPFPVRVLVDAQAETRAKIHLWQEGTLVETREVVLQPGPNVERFQLNLTEAGFFGIQAVVEPLDADDRLFQNNTANGFVFARGRAQVLYVHDDGDPDAVEARHLLSALRAEEILVQVVPAPAFPLRLGDLQAYDAIILDDVARDAFSLGQQDAIEAAVGDMGLGLVMIGGVRAFGPGDWRGTPVEKALPVEMDIKQEEVIPDGALVMVMHSCEIEQGNAMAVKVCKKAVEGLSTKDTVGVLVYGDRGSEWAVRLQRAENKVGIKRSIDAMTIGDMPDFDEIFGMAHKGLQRTEAAVKHMIVMSDGDPNPPAAALLRKCVDERITVSTICYGAHGGSQGPSVDTMKRIANLTGGKYYYLDDIRNLPQIFVKESQRVTRPLIVNKTFTPVVQARSPLLAGISDFPPLTGYVLTEPKEPRADVPLVSPDGQPVLAHWQYGIGKAVAFTSDAKPRWATAWIQWDGFRPFWSQVVRWVSKDVKESLFQVKTSIDGDRGQIVLDAVTEQGEVVDGLAVTARIAGPGPDSPTREVRLRQEGAGRYVGEFPLEGVGTHSVSLVTLDEEGQRRHSVTTGLVVPYSEEFRKLRSDRPALESLAQLSGGRVIELSQLADWSVDPWDRETLGEKVAMEEQWPLALAAALLLFLLDVAVRRVAIDWSRLWARARAALPGGAAQPRTMERLMARKDAVRDARREELAKFEATAPPTGPVEVAGAEGALPAAPPPREASPSSRRQPPPEPTADAEGGYTNRLLEAKRRARRDRDPSASDADLTSESSDDPPTGGD